MASDDFNRASSSTLGANWTVATGNVGEFQIISNTQAANPSGGGFCLEAYTATTPSSADYFSQVTLKGLQSTSDEGPGPAVRILTGSTVGYFVQCNTTETKLYRRDATNGFVQLGADAAACAVDDVIRLTVSGTGATVTLTVNKNGSLFFSRTDSDAARITSTGFPGMWFGGGSAAGVLVVDDWTNQESGGGGGGSSYRSMKGLSSNLRPNAFAPGFGR